MKRFLIVFLCLFLCTALAQAQDTTTISLNEAVDIALENNYQLKVAQNQLTLAGKQVTGEKADFYPSLSASFSGRRNIGNQFVPGTDNFVTQAVDRFSGSLSSSVVLFSGFANVRSLRSAQYGKKTQKQNVEWTKENIIFETSTRFLQVLLDKELLEIAKEQLQTSLKTLNQVKIQTDVGSRPIVDLYNQKAEVANNRLEVTNRKNALQLSRLSLIRTMQLDPLKEYKFIIPDVEVNPETAQNYNLQQLVSVAIKNRSDLQSARYDIKSLKWQLKATKSSYWPTLSLAASISSGYSPSFGQNFSFSEQFFDARISKGFGLSLSIPIFNNLNTRTRVQAAKINYKNAKLNLQDTRLQVVQEVQQAYSDYQAVLEQLQATKVALEAAKKAYQAEQARYEVGAGTLIQLTEASTNLAEAKSNRAQAVYNFIFQEKLLDYYLGKLNKNISFN